MKINKIKKAMGLGQIFGIIVVAIVAAFIINKIRASMSQAESASSTAHEQAKGLLEEMQKYAPKSTPEPAPEKPKG